MYMYIFCCLLFAPSLSTTLCRCLFNFYRATLC